MSKPKVLCVIPARYASTRLPGKPLVDIAGKPMIEHVCTRAQLAANVDKVIVATDDLRVFEAVRKFGSEVVMTSAEHASGTDRLAEVAQKYPDAKIIINVQGDEPLMEPALIETLAEAMLADEQLEMATAKTLLAEADYDNPAAVKVVTDKNGYALYFSRSLIPYPRNRQGAKFYKHIGIYAYRREFLLQFSQLEQGFLEKIESLEQLRALENGSRIKVIFTDFKAVGVDTQEDLALVRSILAKQ